MKTFLSITLALLLFGCNVQKREIAKMEVYAVRYPGPFKTLANTLDPCFNGIAKSDTVITKGKPDTVLTPGSTVITRVNDTVFVTKTSPGRQVTIPFFTTIHDTITNQRALSACQAVGKSATDSLLIVKTQRDLKSKEASKFKLWFWLLAGTLIGIVVVYTGVKVYLLFVTGGAATASSSILSMFKKK